MLDADISGDAALLLMRMRRRADHEEMDGYVSERELTGLTAFHNMKRRSVTRCLSELLDLGLLEKRDEFYVDVEFSVVCRSRTERIHERERWKLNKKNERNKPKSNSDAPMSTEDSPETPEMSSRTAAAAAAAASSTSTSTSAAANGLQADQEATMPNQDAMVDIQNAWVRLAGKDPGIEDVSYFARWLDMFGDRLTSKVITTELERLFTRQAERKDPIGRAKYCDDAIRVLHETSKPVRQVETVRGEGEPPEPSNGSAEPVRQVDVQEWLREIEQRKAQQQPSAGVFNPASLDPVKRA